MTLRFAIPILGLAFLIGGCQQAEDQETGSLDRETVRETRAQLDSALVAALDSGNAAYRNGDYESAREHYQSVVDADEDVAAGWFGIYMAEVALGNQEAADAAMDRARDLAPGASLIHPEADTAP
jgi:uncharacterized membrane-anchored protein